jgi:hypothetical protein
MEGTGDYGAGLARHLADAGELVVELDRPPRCGRGSHRRAAPATGAGHRRTGDGAGPLPRPEHPRDAHRRRPPLGPPTAPPELSTPGAATQPSSPAPRTSPSTAASGAQRGDTLRRRPAVHGAGWPEHRRNRKLVRRLLSRHQQQLHPPEPVHHLRSGVLLRSADDLQAFHEPDRSGYIGNRTSRPIFREDAPSSPITAGSPCSYMPKLPPRSSNGTGSVRLTLTH